MKIGRLYKLKNQWYCSTSTKRKSKILNENDISNEKNQEKMIKQIQKNYKTIDIRNIMFLQFAGMHCTIDQK